jgi:3',5'-cyclic AMP phosphodiesterase CpdA
MKRREFITNSLLTIPTTTALLTDTPPQLMERKMVLRVAHMTDTHLLPEKPAEEGFAKALHSVQELDPKPDFILNGGDAIMDALDRSKEEVKLQWAAWKNIIKNENSLPITHIIGNHDIYGWFRKADDVKGDNLYGKAWVVDELRMPKRYYSFEKNNWKFIVLDSTQLNPAGGYIAFIDNEQIAWLSSELKSTPTSKHICIASHIPIFSACAGLFFGKTEQNGDLLTKRNIMHTDFFKLKNLFKHHKNIKICLSGHVHLQDEVKYLGITYYCNGAVCGNWWKGPFQDFAAAYAVIDFYDDGSFERQFVNY